MGRAESKWMAFSKRDTELLESLSEFLKQVYFSIDPVTFGCKEEQSVEMEEIEPLNAPSMLSSSSSKKLSQQKSGSRLLSHVQSGGSALSMAQGMFGILGNAFAKGTVRRKAELPDLVQTPEAWFLVAIAWDVYLRYYKSSV